MTVHRTLPLERKKSIDYENGNTEVLDVAARGLGVRHMQIASMAVAAFMAFSLRVNLSVAIVAMVDYESDKINISSSALAPTYDWDEKTQGFVLSSFFWGYFTMQIPAGILTEKFGGHRFLCGAILCSSLLTILTPQSAYIGGWILVCVNRMLQGVSQGFVFPSIFALLGVWSPPEERSRLTSLSLGAQLLGIMTTSTISGFLCSTYGWPSVFYSFGIAGVVSGIVMIFLGADNPAKHRMISESEKLYIQRSLGGAKEKLPIPWKGIFTSIPFWSTLIATSFQTMAYFTFLTKIPTYVATVLKFNMDDSGILSSLPYFLCWILTFVFFWTCDFLTSRQWLTITAARKVFNSIAHFGGALCIVLIGYTNNASWSIIYLTICVGLQAGIFTGVQANFVDLAPNFSGTIFSLTNFASASLGISGPIIVGYIVRDAGSASQWQMVFYLLAALLSLSNLVYLFLGTAETQPWNWPRDNEAGFSERKKENTGPSLETDY